MGAHLIDDEFQSDKYREWCPRGFLALKFTDTNAQPYIWGYAQTHRKRDAEFTEDVEAALKNAGYEPPSGSTVTVQDDGAFTQYTKVMMPGVLVLSETCSARMLSATIDALVKKLGARRVSIVVTSLEPL